MRLFFQIKCQVIAREGSFCVHVWIGSLFLQINFACSRHTDTTMERRNLDDKLKEYTTRKLREEWAEHEEMFQLDVGEAIKVSHFYFTGMHLL